MLQFPTNSLPASRQKGHQPISTQFRLMSRWDVAHSGRENLHHFFPILLRRHALSLVVLWLCDYIPLHGHGVPTEPLPSDIILIEFEYFLLFFTTLHIVAPFLMQRATEKDLEYHRLPYGNEQSFKHYYCVNGYLW